jgi:hypothetical protein
VESCSHKSVLIFVILVTNPTDDSEAITKDVLDRLEHLLDIVQHQNASRGKEEWIWWLFSKKGATGKERSCVLPEVRKVLDIGRGDIFNNKHMFNNFI